MTSRCLFFKFIVTILLFTSVFIKSLFAQDISYAREIINKLCSPELHGRGYVAEGDKKAAQYIADQYNSHGLASFNDGYMQNFDISVNTFPGGLEVVLNNKLLVAGKDYLVNPCSPSLSGSFKVVELTKSDLLNSEDLLKTLKKSKGKFLLINKAKLKEESPENLKLINGHINDLKYRSDNLVSGIILLTDEKLTWHASGEVCNMPTLLVYLPEAPEKTNKITCKIVNEFISNYNTQNVIGYIEGFEKPDSVIVFSAHYDHLGRMGQHTYFPGANDNASGTALMLDLARHYSEPGNRPSLTMVFMAFGAEEIGLLGSSHYVENPLFPLKNIKFLINLDIAGTGDEGITVVNGKIFENQFNLLNQINEREKLLPQVKMRGEACNSDHCMFHQKNVPGFFIYTLGGIKAYHDVYDIPETLPLTKYEPYFQLLKQFVSEL
ncbi:MAG: M28 family peptidase [Bacteroidota bacterium]|nr:M28 family peptidase [Bacteroidota bacterium]